MFDKKISGHNKILGALNPKAPPMATGLTVCGNDDEDSSLKRQMRPD